MRVGWTSGATPAVCPATSDVIGASSRSSTWNIISMCFIASRAHWRDRDRWSSSAGLASGRRVSIRSGSRWGKGAPGNVLIVCGTPDDINNPAIHIILAYECDPYGKGMATMRIPSEAEKVLARKAFHGKYGHEP